VQDLWNEYQNIFKYGNRNAASHLWSLSSVGLHVVHVCKFERLAVWMVA